MVSRILVRKLLRDLWGRKWAIIALIAMEAVGVGVFSSMAGVYEDLDSAREKYYRKYQLADFTVDLKRAPEWSIELVKALPNVMNARGRISLAVMLHMTPKNRPVPGLALSLPSSQVPIIDGAFLLTGAWFSGDRAEEVILDHQFAEANHIKPGDRIKVMLVDKQHDLLVVGTAMAPEFVYLMAPGGGLSPNPKGYGVMYLPHGFLQDAADLQGAYNQIVGSAHDSSRGALTVTLKRISAELDPYGVTNTVPIQDHPSASVVRDELRNIKTTAAIFPILFLGMGALVLNIMLSRMVAQQRLVIGTLRALGYSRGAVMSHYVGYGVVIGLLGGVSGIVTGWLLQKGMVGIYSQVFAIPGIEAHVHPSIMGIGVAIAVAFAIVGALKGGRKASKLEPAEAMHPPAPEKGGHVVLERIPFLWNLLSFRWKIVVRAVLRNPVRSSVGLMASCIATALLLASFSLFDGTFYLIDFHFNKVAHQDVTIALRDPKGVESFYEIEDLGSVSSAEPRLSVMSDFKNGQRQRRIAIEGLPPHSRLYTPLQESGARLIVPDEGLVLSKKLAEVMGLNVGDEVVVRPLIGRRIETRTVVVGKVDTYLGMSAYCSLEYLSRLLGERWVSNSYLTTIFPGGVTSRLIEKLGRFPTVIGITRRKLDSDRMKAQMSEFIGTFFGAAIIFSGIIAFGGILNTALISLSEREREVGAFRVLGYAPRQVLVIFAGESILVNAVGIALGLGVGIGAAHLLALAFNTELYRFPAIVYGSRLVLCFALMMLFVVCAQVVVYFMIRGLEWLDVMKTRG